MEVRLILERFAAGAIILMIVGLLLSMLHDFTIYYEALSPLELFTFLTGTVLFFLGVITIMGVFIIVIVKSFINRMEEKENE